MKYKSWKCNLLFLLSRITLSKEFKMLCKEYLKVRDNAPEMAKQAWQCFTDNYKLRKKYSGQYKIISLGWNCMPRTLLTLWMLKPSKGSGEKGMPFDLIGTSPGAVAHFLENDFADYFAGKWVYKTLNGYTCWYNEIRDNISYPHEHWCDSTAEGLKALQKRVAERINNFREAMAFEGPVLFVCNKSKLWDTIPLDHKTEDIEDVCREIARLRGGKPFKIVVWACNHNDECEKIEGAKLLKILYPHAQYIWHREERFTPAGVKFEIELMNACRDALEELITESKNTGKKPL